MTVSRWYSDHSNDKPEIMIQKINNPDKFLEEYESICKKYNIYVDGCGCCGSPFLTFSAGEEGNQKLIQKHIEHLKGAS